MERILRIDMTDRTAAFEPVPDEYKGRAGRWLTSSIIHDEVPADCHPLGPSNKLVFSPGIVTGTAAPTSSRISVGGKSPLTGTIKESNAGTGWGRRWGGKMLSEVYADLHELHGNKDVIDICAIGVAGEHRMAAAGICFSDQEGRASRYSGRGGLGAVMGSKGIKAIVLDDTGAPGVSLADKDLFEEGRKKLAAALTSHDITKPKGGASSAARTPGIARTGASTHRASSMNPTGRSGPTAGSTISTGSPR